MTDKERLEALKLSEPKEIDIRLYLLNAIRTELTNDGSGTLCLTNADCESNDDLLSFVECSIIEPENFDMLALEDEDYPMEGTLEFTYNDVIEFMTKYNLIP